MAESLAHKWGQIIGNLLQEALREVMQRVAEQHGLYLDYQRARPARRGLRVTWEDRSGNAHDLDYVLERGGNDEVRGLPAAFIETAWRRYTKHSRNKAQEIQGAILALAETYSRLRPFLGVVLAGVFTQGSLTQLRSCGFSVAYISYDTILRAFASAGIDAAFDETTKESAFRKKIRQYESLSDAQIQQVRNALVDFPTDDSSSQHDEPPLRQFLADLNSSLSRGVSGVTVLVLHGSPHHWTNLIEAIAYLEGYDSTQPSSEPAVKYEVDVRYNNGDVVHGLFHEKGEAVRFLRTFV
jgi:hypothetical protein